MAVQKVVSMGESHEVNSDLVPLTADPNALFAEYGTDWYPVATGYWARQEASVNGMLGGFEQLTGFDILSAREFIEKYQSRRKNPLGKQSVADCACGIGRVAKWALADYFAEIDLVDAVAHFLDQAADVVAKEGATVRKIVSGIQEWIPDRDYDAFWIQWGLMYLTDVDCVNFLRRCKQHLKPNGLIFVKDNLASADVKAARDTAQFFKEDRGLCRAYQHYCDLFKEANLQFVEGERLKQWPSYMLPLYTFILQ
jgi:protein N-terminal methyltransferase